MQGDDGRDCIHGFKLQHIKALLIVLRAPVSGNQDALVERALANIFHTYSCSVLQGEGEGSFADEALNQQASVGHYYVADRGKDDYRQLQYSCMFCPKTTKILLDLIFLDTQNQFWPARG